MVEFNNTIKWENSFYNKWFEKGYSFHRGYFWLPKQRICAFAHLQWLYDLSDTEYLNYITLAVY